MTPTQHLALLSVVRDVIAERHRQHAKWGEQNWPDGTGRQQDKTAVEIAQDLCNVATQRGTLTYRHILEEEFCEALGESDPAALREELVQVAAVCVAWVEKLDREAAAAEQEAA